MRKRTKKNQLAVRRMQDWLTERGRALVDRISGLNDEQIRNFHIVIDVDIRRGYDLRATLAEKTIDCFPHTQWTAFVNNKHTLIHIVHRDGDLHVRVPLYKGMKTASDTHVRAIVHNKMFGRFL